MRIKEVSTEQFAGIRDKKAAFSDGINVVYGKNESGKSTLVNLLLGLLFRDVKLKLNNKSDKDFKTNVFPAERLDGKRFDSIDGSVVFETADGEYKLFKTWGSEERSKLTTPTGIVKDRERINEILSEILGCKEGVYKEMLLSPQSSAAENLQRVLNNSSETGKTLADAVSRAFAESDGISIDALENKINEAVSALAGKWWDAENKRPLKNGYTDRSQQLGEIMKSLLVLEKAEGDRRKLEELEIAYNKALTDHSEKQKLADDRERELKEFDECFDRINAVDLNRKIVDSCTRNIERYKSALAALPKDKAALERAKALEKEKKSRALLDQYAAAKKQHDVLLETDEKLNGLLRPDSEDIGALKSAERELPLLESKLRGMDIIAKIKTHGANNVKITSLLTGEELAIGSESVRIEEAVRVEIPGIMEMELSPAGEDIDEIASRITELKTLRSDTLAKYAASSADEIERSEKQYNELLADKRIAENALSATLSDISYEELEQMAAGLNGIRVASVIDGEISELCGNMDIAEFIGNKTQAIRKFTEDHESEEALERLIAECAEEREKALRAIGAADNIPRKYADITDPKRYKDELQKEFERTRAEKDNALAEMTGRQRELELFEETEGDRLGERYESAKREYDEKVGLLDRWLHIKKVFEAHKAALTSDPLEALARNFSEYLGRISGGRVNAEFPENGKLCFNVLSGDFAPDFAKLSDGTKETVFLAFRLAVLGHLFPDGGGLIVLDDPLNDMDADRAERSCKLITEIAQKHQVIFLTCREEYVKLLGGNEIHI